MSKPKFIKTMIEIRTGETVINVPGFIFSPDNLLGYHKMKTSRDERYYSLDHIPTGMKICHCKKAGDVRLLIQQLCPEPWNFTREDLSLTGNLPKKVDLQALFIELAKAKLKVTGIVDPFKF